MKKVHRAIAILAVIVCFSTGARPLSFYLPYTYPGAIGYFEYQRGKRLKVTLKTGGKKFTFYGNSGKVYFAIPYHARKSVVISLLANGLEIDRRKVTVKHRTYPVSRIRVKERKLTPELLRRIKREGKLLRSILRQVTRKKFSETTMVKPLKKLIITTPFGARRIINGKKHSIHWGVDFKAPKGTPVICALSGKVVLAKELYYTGKTVVIDHGAGLHTLYAHLSKISVKEGEYVKAGEKVGAVGSTGRSTGPHLHFGVYVCGVKADPMLALKSKL